MDPSFSSARPRTASFLGHGIFSKKNQTTEEKQLNASGNESLLEDIDSSRPPNFGRGIEPQRKAPAKRKEPKGTERNRKESLVGRKVFEWENFKTKGEPKETESPKLPV